MLICGQTHSESRNKAAVKYKKYFMFINGKPCVAEYRLLSQPHKSSLYLYHYDLITRAISALSLPAIFGICT